MSSVGVTVTTLETTVSKEGMFKQTLKWQRSLLCQREEGDIHCANTGHPHREKSAAVTLPYPWLWQLGCSETAQGACARLLNLLSQEM